MGGRLRGKVAIVTGGASGIGAAIVRRFVAEGAFCVIADVHPAGGEALADELGSAAAFARVDVTIEDDIAAVVDLAVRERGRLDCMVNNAGILGVVGPIADTEAAAWDHTVAVLLRGVFLGIKHGARVMIPRRAGTIINLASTAGIHAGLGPHAYTAAKHGVVGLTGSVAPELARHGIRTNCIAPGGVVTGMTATVVGGDPSATDVAAERLGAVSPSGRAGQPEDVANVALFLASDEAGLVNGACVVADGASEVISSRAVRQYSPAPPGFLQGP
jgi:NAD(P)-dependent dehydrogenase (short-subunit alcohol dehydrogenase family)